jgi:hypothetical protein
LKRADRRLGRLAAPELLDQPVGRDHLAGTECQEREQRTLLLASQLESATGNTDLDRSEQADLDARHMSFLHRCRRRVQSAREPGVSRA